MSKSREAFVSVGSALVLAIGASGCAGTKPAKKAELPRRPAQATDYNREIKDLTVDLFKLAVSSRHRFVPSNYNAENFGVEVPTEDSGQLSVEAGYGESLTATNKDTLTQPYTVIVKQTFPDQTGLQSPEPNGGHNGFDMGFELYFSQEDDGNWDVGCSDNALQADIIGEADMKTVDFAGEAYTLTSPALARVILQNSIGAIGEAMVDASHQMRGHQIAPMGDACLMSFSHGSGSITVGFP